MGRIALIAVALVLLTAAPDARAGLLSIAKHAAEYAGHAGHAGKVAKEADGVKIETKGLEATGAPAEANGVTGEAEGGSAGEQPAEK
jgi:hypothetical protein